MTVTVGKGTPTGTNAPGGGWSLARALISTSAFSLTSIGFRVTAINATHTSKYRVAVYGNNAGTPGALLGNSNEVGFSDGIVAASATEFTVALITPVAITNGLTYFVALIQNPNSDLTMATDDGSGTDSANTTGYYISGSNANTVPANPWGSFNTTASAWMIWGLGASAYQLDAAKGAFVLTGKDVFSAPILTAAVGLFTLTGGLVLISARLVAAAGTFVLTGKAVTWASGLLAGTGFFSFSGFAANFLGVRVRRLVAPFAKLVHSVSLRKSRDTPPKLSK